MTFSHLLLFVVLPALMIFGFFIPLGILHRVKFYQGSHYPFKMVLKAISPQENPQLAIDQVFKWLKQNSQTPHRAVVVNNSYGKFAGVLLDDPNEFPNKTHESFFFQSLTESSASIGEFPYQGKLSLHFAKKRVPKYLQAAQKKAGINANLEIFDQSNHKLFYMIAPHFEEIRPN